MQPPAGVADFCREPRLQRGVNILVVERDLPVAVCEPHFEFSETDADVGAVLTRNKAASGEHLGVSY